MAKHGEVVPFWKFVLLAKSSIVLVLMYAIGQPRGSEYLDVSKKDRVGVSPLQDLSIASTIVGCTQDSKHVCFIVHRAV